MQSQGYTEVYAKRLEHAKTKVYLETSPPSTPQPGILLTLRPSPGQPATHDFLAAKQGKDTAESSRPCHLSKDGGMRVVFRIREQLKIRHDGASDSNRSLETSTHARECRCAPIPTGAPHSAMGSLQASSRGFQQVRCLAGIF